MGNCIRSLGEIQVDKSVSFFHIVKKLNSKRASKLQSFPFMHQKSRVIVTTGSQRILNVEVTHSTA